MQLVADRAGISRTTLYSIERGEASASLGSYAKVLHSLGLHEDIGLLGRDDELGRKLQDAKLPTPRRGHRRSRA